MPDFQRWPLTGSPMVFYSISLTAYRHEGSFTGIFLPTEICGCSDILRLHTVYHHIKYRPVVTNLIAVPLELTLPRLQSHSESVFTACYCHVSQWLILSNWVMITILPSDTCTARLVQSTASSTQRNWVRLTCSTGHTAGETLKSNKSNCRHQTHTRAGMHKHIYTHSQTELVLAQAKPYKKCNWL